MAGGRKQLRAASTGLKWQTFHTIKSHTAGRKPLPGPVTLMQLGITLLMHVCRKIVLLKPERKICIYTGVVFFASLICDFLPFPRSYFSRQDNFMNQYFIKLGWGWTLLVVAVFVYFTSRIYCCNDLVLIRKHMSRLLVGTLVWFCFTTLFEYIEIWTAECQVRGQGKKYKTKDLCKENGHKWMGFDISGDTFLLIYCCLIIMEEGKCIKGWERIGELIIRNDEFEDESPLKTLSEEQMSELKKSYEQYTQYVRLTFVLMTVLLLLWDVMLMATTLYFHNMVQKLVGNVFAVGVWFATYRLWYQVKLSPGLPGVGLFNYLDLQN
ncbi:FIT family protein CG10671-like [Limulus polyphemus]|uniref:FIT family protein CG10671-like n=1 Tax=Limulus polyphemus TaxID=6850 RepID=A0ABM1BHY8_LIMPO|nr:FIT family protein CG10671-like [Limulus polyphemus]